MTELQYVSHRISSGKPALTGLPSVYAENEDEAQTLLVTLVDSKAGLEVELFYTVFEAFDAVIRSTRIVNASADVMTLRSALSVSVICRMTASTCFSCLELGRVSVTYIAGRLLLETQSVESRRGSSSHMNNPFFALLSEDAGMRMLAKCSDSASFIAAASLGE